MVRGTVTDRGAWPYLSLEGNLLTPAMVARIGQPREDGATRASYGVRKGLTLREEISTAFRVGQSHWEAFSRQRHPSLAATQRFVKSFLAETFGFQDLAPADGFVSFVAGERAPVVVAPPGEELERRSRSLSTVDCSRSPAFALQDWLNGQPHALWGLVTNGARIRLMRDNASLTRPAWIEADLEGIFGNGDASSFAVFWLLIHRSRFGGAGAAAKDCALERWRDEGAREGAVARERLAAQVQEALKLLGSGFLGANPGLAAQLKSGHVPLADWFNELLRLVYRLIFLMVAEDRNLLHSPAHGECSSQRLYREGYSLTTLRRQCQRRATWDKHHDRYEGAKVVFLALARGEERLALPALGGFFAADQLPRLEGCICPNHAFMGALYHLGWLQEKTGKVPVNWRAMETEELGSVYESLLELQPQLADDGRSLVFASEASERQGNQRKTTGSYYTPDSLVQALLDTALDPVLDATEAKAAEPAAALLRLTVLDPACGSGHFLLAAARRMATRLARHRADGVPELADFRRALRDVTRCCIHGVDRNPMAVELTKVALWIETVNPGYPLGFLDGQIRCGDALLGLMDLAVLEEGIPDAAYKPLSGDDKRTANHYKKANRAAKQGQTEMDFRTGAAVVPALRPVAVAFAGVRRLGEDTVRQIRNKAARMRALRQSPDFCRLQQAADLYVSAFLLPKTGGAPAGPQNRTAPTSNELWRTLAGEAPSASMTAAVAVARGVRAFHWPLEFPDVMMERGGFDCVLGNPPWEMMQLDPREFFAARHPEIAKAPNMAARNRLINELANDNPLLHQEFLRARLNIDGSQAFVHGSGRFPLTSHGRINLAPLFAETSLSLLKDESRAGLILPTGIVTDSFTQHFCRHILENHHTASVYDFENREAIFPGVHRSTKFVLLTLGHGVPAADFLFFATNVAQLKDEHRHFSLSAEDVALLNPNTATCPVFRSRMDAKLTKAIYQRVPVLINESKGEKGNPWRMKFNLMFMMNTDSHLFHTEPGPELTPLYEAKFIHHYDHRWASCTNGKCNTVSLANKQDPSFSIQPRYWVQRQEVHSRLQQQGWRRSWLMGWRDIARSTDERTVIASVFPRAGVGHKILLMLPDCEEGPDPQYLAALLGNLSCLVYDFFARQKIGGTSMSYFIFKQLPVLPPSAYGDAELAFILPRVLELTFTSHHLSPWAKDLGHTGPPFLFQPERRALLKAQLDAFYARLYGLNRDELRYILDPADPMGPDYPSQTFRVLKEGEIKQFGEYRTQRLVLEAWDRLFG